MDTPDIDIEGLEPTVNNHIMCHSLIYAAFFWQQLGFSFVHKQLDNIVLFVVTK